MPLNVFAPVQTRSGRAARIVGFLRGPQPIIAVLSPLFEGESEESVETFTADGSFFESGQVSHLDLINVAAANREVDEDQLGFGLEPAESAPCAEDLAADRSTRAYLGERV